ncbi:MAG: DUF2029 domain-containing protein [Chloroflexi bacterium]|nr:DUF2029 domain-containing protein [Chloroflexota bacterium]
MTTMLPPLLDGENPVPRNARRRLPLVGLVVSLLVLGGAALVATLAQPPGQPERASDLIGRLGFVLLLAAALAGVWLLDARARATVLPAADIFVPTRFIVAIFAVFASTWVIYDQLVLDAFSRGRFGYLEWLTQVATLAASRGMWNIWTPYPQGTQALITAIDSVAGGLGALTGSDVWSAYTFFRLGFELVFLVVPAILSVWLVGAAARPLGRSTATIAALTLALSFGIVYYGAATVYVTDLLPVALTIAAALAVTRGRLVLAGLAIGFGTVLKLFPVLLLVPLVVLLRRRDALRVVGVTAIVVLLVLGPFAALNPGMFVSPFNWQASRPPWETWFAFVNWMTGAPHDFSQPYFQDAAVGSAYGWVFTGITPPVSVLQTPVPSGPLRWENLTSLVFTALAVGLVIVFARPRAHTPRSVIRWSLFTLCAFFFFSIGWSPQYELFLIPLMLLAFDDPRVGAATALALQAVTFIDYPLLLPWAYFYGGAAVWLEWGAVLARYVLLGWLCVWVLRTEARIGDVRGRLLRGSSLALALAAPLTLAFSAPVAQTPSAADSCGTSHATPSSAVSLPPTATDWPVHDGWFYGEASDATGMGFSIVNDDYAQMYSEFTRLGGWQVLGYPASQRFVWHGALSQVTQRAVLQWSPVTGQVDFANILDLLHDQGLDAELQQEDQIPPPMDVDEAGLPYETIAANRLSWLDARPAIRAAYCAAPGGGDPIELWGLPTSLAVNMGGPGGDVYVLRTQRAAFQEWVAGAPWAAPGQVTVVLAGDLAKEFGLLPPDALVPRSASQA